MKNKSILLLGSTGMAGHMIYYYLKEKNKYDIIDVCYRKKLTESSIVLDIKDGTKLEQLIVQIKPNYIINCIGILIKGSADVENAVYINAYFPHFLKKIADKVNSKLIHLSTDCVFSGKDGNYSEEAFKDADDIYGRSKALGEISDANHLTIRTSIIGPELKSSGEGLFHWFMAQQGEVTGYTNAIWGGVTTLELAKAIEFFLNNNSASKVVHLTNGRKISKYELLELFKSVWHLSNINVVPGQGKKDVNKSLCKSQSFKFDVSSYLDMLTEQYAFMCHHKPLYSLYQC